MSRFKIGEAVEVLDGSNAKVYVGGWAEGMEQYVGKVGRIVDVFGTDDYCYAYELDFDDDYWFDENYLAPVGYKPSKSPTFSYREVRRIKEFLLKIEKQNGLGGLLIEDESLATIILDALEWFTEFYEGE